MDLQVLPIETYQQFVDLANQFDSFYQTKTYITYLTLKEINDNFVNRNIYNYLKHLIDNLFFSSHVVYSSDPWLNDGHIGKINAISKIIDDIRCGTGITTPMSMSWFGKGRYGVHPGTTRILLADVYKEKIPLVITDHTNKFKQKHKWLDLVEPNQIFEKSVIGMKFAIDNTKLSDSPRVYRDVAKNTVFKELNDHNDFYAKPTLANPPREYKLEDNKLYVDSICYACYTNKQWNLKI
jgi:hypothetical protein